MSRLKHFGHSLISGYILLGANVLYTLASVRLALDHLSVKEFGLWALTSQVAGYIAFIDMGMSNSVSRILMDHKDDRAGGNYGSAGGCNPQGISGHRQARLQGYRVAGQILEIFNRAVQHP